MVQLSKRKIHLRKIKAEASETCNSSGDELNDVEDGEISILRPEEADNVITRLMQTVSEMVNRHINTNDDSISDSIGSDSDSETFGSDSEVETAKRNIIVAEAARKGVYHAQVRKGMYIDGHEYTDVVAYRERFLERMAEFEARMVVFSDENMEEETRPDFDDIIILITYDDEFLIDIGERLVLHEEDKVYMQHAILQVICFPEDYKNPDLHGELKGLKQVLGERGLWRDGIKLACKGGCEQGKTDSRF
ncbi:8250_t:CDS:2 [Racocetra fulgida]|uniref:8250_t:CDS:1 n=1 Tax=Racocetra fulgida TaxID=60492 RepID=A0A9N8WD17_9GLOM|nr:8250_t:CDS:2 [Racocetra fulgida]